MPLNAQQSKAVAHVAGLTIMNALVFQEVLAAQKPAVSTLRQSLADPDSITTALTRNWQQIMTEIDFVPIFSVAKRLLEALPANQDINAAIEEMAENALRIVERRAALRHDLMGRVYHRLLVEAKHLGTFYTSVPAATLLLKLALDPSAWQTTDWSAVETITGLRIGDLACGTGTLLMAAAEALTDNYVRASAPDSQKLDLEGLHRGLMESVIHGFDVLPAALHLTASTLALRAASVGFELTHLFTLPLGTDEVRLGSVEFLQTPELHASVDLLGNMTMFEQVAGGGNVEHPIVRVPELDLCVMNPPFTRSVGGNLLFGNLPAAQRARAQAKLAQILRDRRAPVLADSTAGLGSVFVAVGDRRLAADGRLALILPKAVLSGVSWGNTRTLLESTYEVEHIVVSHEPERWNFSENTNLSEVLIVARKRRQAADVDLARTVRVANLWRNPGTVFEALSIAQTLQAQEPPDVATGQGALELRIGAQKVGEAVSVPWGQLRGKSWLLPAAFAQADLIRCATSLASGELFIPGRAERSQIPLQELGRLGELGPDVRDISDGFADSPTPTPYAAVKGHNSRERTRILIEASQYLSPLARAKPGRPLRRAEVLWPRSGRILLAERLRFNTQRLTAALADRPVLATSWWPVAPTVEMSEAHQKALVVWLNSTLGLISLLASRVETEGSWMKFKKPMYEKLPILDVMSLDQEQLAALVAGFDGVAARDLQPFRNLNQDPARGALDDALSRAFGLGDLSVLRELMAREPIVSNGAIG